MATPALTATPAAYADTLRIGGVDWGDQGMEMDVFRQGSYGPNGWYVPSHFIGLGSLVYSALYRYDAYMNPVPDLADGPCVPQADPKVIRCRLIETTFQDGTPLTADDVAYTYRLFQRETIYGGTPPIGPFTRTLTEVRVVDPRTVDFVLSTVDPPFMTNVLPTIWILSHRAVEAAYADFVAQTGDLEAADLAALADAIDEEIAGDPPVCTTRLAAVDALLAQIGAHLYREGFSRATGSFAACTYMGAASGFIRRAANALGYTGLDAVAAAFMLLSTDWQPIGTGPYRFVSEDADRVHLEAWAGHHGGLAATRYVDFVPSKGDGSDVAAGTIDVFQMLYASAAYQAAAAAHGVRVAVFAVPGFIGMLINVRPGRLFADPALRRALQLCIDLPRAVDAATGGGVKPLYGPLVPGSWADDPDLPKLARDVTAAKRLIEGAGWTLGADGVYTKGGARLAAQIATYAGFESVRAKMADLIGHDARDCGMDITTLPYTEAPDLGQYPHNMPGTTTPFDLWIVNWNVAPDPDDALSLFSSSNASSAENPYGSNVGGFSNAAFDRLLEAGLATYDQAARMPIYRQAQEELAAQVPAVFLWTNGGNDAVRSAVTTLDGPLDLSVPFWAWAPERLVVAATGD